MTKTLRLSLLLLSLYTTALAQKAPDINLPSIATDRPDQTESPILVPKGWFQIEAGAWTENLTPKGTAGKLMSTTTPTILTKYGVNKNFELRLITEFNKTDGLEAGITPITVGFKHKLLEEKGIQPQTSVICHLGIGNTGGKDLKTPYTAPSFRFLMSHSLSDRLNFSYNLGGEWNGITPGGNAIYTASFAYAFSKRLGGFLESYGFMPKGFKNNDHRADAGITYLLNNNHQLDVSGGLGLTKYSPSYFVSCGYSFRF
ncbi:MAG: hypothetical protein RL660_1673 [Bacteroidota bacterium]|jgi:hypothetical protein